MTNARLITPKGDKYLEQFTVAIDISGADLNDIEETITELREWVRKCNNTCQTWLDDLLDIIEQK